jgi:hypothetical protein
VPDDGGFGGLHNHSVGVVCFSRSKIHVDTQKSFQNDPGSRGLH